jgi:hypothetical protein
MTEVKKTLLIFGGFLWLCGLAFMAIPAAKTGVASAGIAGTLMIIAGVFTQRTDIAGWAGLFLSALCFVAFTYVFIQRLYAFQGYYEKLPGVLLVWVMTLGTAVTFVLLLRTLINPDKVASA